MSKPTRIQRRRTRGWKKPENTMYVGRPGPFGNPFVGKGYGPDWEAKEFSAWLNPRHTNRWPHLTEQREELLRRISELRGKNLACWCALDQPCHADVLLEIANA